MERHQALSTTREVRRLTSRILRSPRSLPARLQAGHLVFGLPTSVGLRLAAPFRSLKELVRWGATAKRMSGTPLWRQLVDLLTISLRWRHAPRLYYVWELFRDGRVADAPLYVDTMQNVEIQFAALRKRRSRDGGKVDFHDTCVKHGLRTVPLLATCSGRREPILLDLDSLEWEGDLYEKPAHGGQGKGIRRWERQEDGSWTSEGLRAGSRDELLSIISAAARKDVHMIQPRRYNHPDLDWVPNGPISTIRVTTLRPFGGGTIEYVPTVMRIPRTGASVDNLHQGGLPAPVDIHTGTIQPITSWRGISEGPGIEAHPDNGKPIAGVVIPFWEEALDLCRRAQETFSKRASVGWDVGIDPEGPFLLEMNGLWGCDLMQAGKNPPFGLTPYGEIMLRHLQVLRPR